mmetsp:Transcript_4187/g.8628  ORF Transcript_4187/g.8628 Transcript_4187/m.8628 type:complete len:284 (+) Transcript_4187:224-1075(+)|eukprot:CAMPEP_0118951726 /NCGR_PEP_ID=MMETSP1169-20130426/53617_1 /TAXON_ID=36882 /ORGANISM="Pyramimonas obovata, Strain CCMP722" /LENGTH=283 /DNA_ID=CAMNT_0006898837 /DNA_START=137 /DNA_END=988 /DNA_ORIENTATION=-
MSKAPSNDRVFIGYGSGAEGKFAKLPDPRTGKANSYLLRSGSLQEINWFKLRLTSWFVGESVVEDGGVYMSTLVDPLFVLLPILEQGRQTTTEKPQGQFRPLEDILMDAQAQYPAMELLKDAVSASLPLICQVAGRGSDKYYRLDDDQVVAWLACKVEQLAESLLHGPNQAFAGMGKAGVRAYAVEFLSEWVSESWLEKLQKAFGITASPITAQATPKAAPTSKWCTAPESAEVMQFADKAPAKRPAAVQKSTPADKARQTKMAKLAKDSKGMAKMSSFFTKR